MKHYTFIDYATQGYIALVAAILVVLHGSAVPGWQWLAGAHLLCLALIHWLIFASAARPANRALDFLRHFYPVLLYTGFYRETGALNQMLSTGYADGWFIRLDEMIFGFQPSLKFMQAFPSVWVSELFYVSYFSYYLMIFGIGLALFLRNRQQFYHYISVVSFVFYACYLTYIFLPVVGPRIIYSDLVEFTPPPEVLPVASWVFPETVQGGGLLQGNGADLQELRGAGRSIPKQPCRHRPGDCVFLVPLPAHDPLAASGSVGPALPVHGILPVSLRCGCAGGGADHGGIASAWQLALPAI